MQTVPHDTRINPQKMLVYTTLEGAAVVCLFSSSASLSVGFASHSAGQQPSTVFCRAVSMQPRALQSTSSASDMWTAAGDLDLHAVKLQLSGLFAESSEIRCRRRW